MTGDDVRELRERLGWSRKELGVMVSDALGRRWSRPENMIGGYERGNDPIPSDISVFLRTIAESDEEPARPSLPPRKRRTPASDSAPVAEGPDLRASDLVMPARPYSALCEEFFDLIATGVGMIGAATGNPALQADGLIIHERKSELGAAYGKLAETNETFRNLITQTERQGAYLAVAMVTGTTAGAIMRNHAEHRFARRQPQNAEEALQAMREDGAELDGEPIAETHAY